MHESVYDYENIKNYDYCKRFPATDAEWLCTAVEQMFLCKNSGVTREGNIGNSTLNKCLVPNIIS